MFLRKFVAIACVGLGAGITGIPVEAWAQTRQTTTDADDPAARKPTENQRARPAGKAALAARPADGKSSKSDETPAGVRPDRPLISNDGKFTVGGAIRARYDARFNDAKLDGSRTTSNHFSFDTLALKLKYDSSTLFGAAQWRFYGASFIYGKRNGYQNYPGEVQFPLWAYAGYKVTPKDSVTAGINQAPFGLTPYFGASFIETMGFAAGVEEVYNLGVKYTHTDDKYDFDVAYYPGAAPDAIGISRDSARYSTNMVRADAYVPDGSDNHERNMVVGRYEYAFVKTDVTSFTAGVSGWLSQVHNLDNGRDGWKALEGVHFNASYYNWGFKGIYVRQDIKAKNPGRDDIVTIGGFDSSYNMATRGNFFSGEVSYKIPNDIGPFAVMPYLNYSAYVKDKDAFETSQRYVLGAAWTFKQDPRLVIYSEGILGKNDPYVGSGQFESGLAQGGDDKWKKSVIVNIGFYF